MFDVHVFVYTFMSISEAWASALFILDRWAMREPKRWDKQSFDSRAFSLCFRVIDDYHAVLGACRKHKGQTMKKFKMKPKVLLAMAVLSLLPFGMSAQEGMFRRGVSDVTSCGNGSTNGMMGRSEGAVGGYFTGQGFGATSGDLTGQGFGATNGNITGQTFGAPLGSGLFFLLTAGIGYSALKSKKTKQNQNGKEK